MSIQIVQSTISSIPQTTFTGADAAAILTQVLALTDASGNKIFEVSALVPGAFTIPVVVTADAGGNLQSISFAGHQ